MRPGSRAALRSTFALAVLAALVVTGPLSATAAAPADHGSGAGPAVTGAAGAPDVSSLQDGTPERSGTRMTVQLQPDGDAHWQVSTSFRLNDSDDRAAFDDLAERFERGDADVGFDVATFRRALTAANGTVNRTMRLRQVERQSRIVEGTDGNATGRLILRFTWTNFGTVGNDTYRFGDAFTTDEGTWLPGLASGQTLVVRPPTGFGVDTAPVAPRDGSLRWEGPQEFDPGYLSATYRRTGPATPTPTPTPTPTTGPGSPDSPTPATGNTTTTTPEQDRTLVLLGGLGGIIALALAIVLLARGRAGDLPGGEPAGTNGGPPGAAAEPGGETDDGDGEPEAPTEAAGATATDPELLSDEERVERLLEENGGRMKQGNIVSETGWSNAKVSQLLSTMDEEDRVDKLRIGRENLISLPDQDVTDIEDDEE